MYSGKRLKSLQWDQTGFVSKNLAASGLKGTGLFKICRRLIETKKEKKFLEGEKASGRS